LAVADCSAAAWPLVGLWESGLRDKSKKVGYTIYGDWQGHMRADYGFVKNDANFLIIDPNGVIRVRKHGHVKAAETQEILDLLQALLG
jgi:predicted transcriptional regulator